MHKRAPVLGVMTAPTSTMSLALVDAESLKAKVDLNPRAEEDPQAEKAKAKEKVDLAVPVKEGSPQRALQIDRLAGFTAGEPELKVRIATSGTSERFDGGIREAYQRFKNGAIGELISIRALHQHGDIGSFPKGDWYWDEEQGGPERSLVWDAADIFRWFADSEVARVYAEYDNYLSENSPFMDNGKIILRFENRVMGSIDIYFSVSGFQFPSYEIELVGTTGAIRTQQSVYEGTLFTSAGMSNFYRTQNNILLD